MTEVSGCNSEGQACSSVDYLVLGVEGLKPSCDH